MDTCRCGECPTYEDVLDHERILRFADAFAAIGMAATVVDMEREITNHSLQVALRDIANCIGLDHDHDACHSAPGAMTRIVRETPRREKCSRCGKLEQVGMRHACVAPEAK